MKHKLLNIIPECYVDTNLVEFLVDCPVNHQHSCTKVVGLLEGKFNDSFAIGIIDKDKVQMGYLAFCDEVATTDHLTLFKHKERCQYIITIWPAIDRFIMDNAAAEGLNLAGFGLPSKLKDFTNITKSVNSNRDPRFKNLFVALSKNREIKNLRATLLYLIENKYNTDIESLKNIFEAL